MYIEKSATSPGGNSYLELCDEALLLYNIIVISTLKPYAEDLPLLPSLFVCSILPNV